MPARPGYPAASALPRFSIPLDENGFVDWLIDSEPGDTIAYYRGHLSHDRMPSTKVLDDDRRRKLAAVAGRVLAAEAQGLVMPVQRRAGPHEWLYLAVRTRGPMRSTHNAKHPNHTDRQVRPSVRSVQHV